jgi:hypothetical protein
MDAHGKLAVKAGGFREPRAAQLAGLLRLNHARYIIGA